MNPKLKNLCTMFLFMTPFVVGAMVGGSPNQNISIQPDGFPQYQGINGTSPRYTGLKPVIFKACTDGNTLIVGYNVKRFVVGKATNEFVEDKGWVQKVEVRDASGRSAGQNGRARWVTLSSVSGGESYRRASIYGAHFRQVRVWYDDTADTTKARHTVVPSDPFTVTGVCKTA